MSAMSFPCTLEEGLGRFRPLSEAEEVAQSVRLILSTNKGERPFRPQFGTGVSRYAFESVDTTLLTLIRQEIVAALQTWEPRIWKIQVEFEPNQNEGVLIARISYELRQGGTPAQIEVPLQTA